MKLASNAHEWWCNDRSSSMPFLFSPGIKFAPGSECNVSMLTLDGVDVMGERLAEEIMKVIRRKPEVRKISFIAHSVGGLVARYTIERLYRHPRRENSEIESVGAQDEDSRGTISGLEAMNFITVATPHLGSRGNKQAAAMFKVMKNESPPIPDTLAPEGF